MDLSKCEAMRKAAGVHPESNVYYNILDSLMGLAKCKKMRMKTDEADVILQFLVKLASLVLFGDESNQVSLLHASIFQEMASLHLQMTSQLGESKYDPEDIPMKHATRCLEIFNKVMEG